MKKSLMNKKNKGFSLVELIIVVAIMAILAGVLVPQFIRYIGASRINGDLQNAQLIYDGVSAMIAQDGANGTSLSADPYTTATNDGFTISATNVNTLTTGNAILNAIGGSAAAVKVDNTYHFEVSADRDGNVTVNVNNGTDTVQLCPYDETAAAGTAWEK